MRQLDLTAIVPGSIVIVFFAFACWLLDDKPFDRLDTARSARPTVQAMLEPTAPAGPQWRR